MPHKNDEHAPIRTCIGIDTIESNEEIFMVVRKHWVVLIKTITLSTLLTLFASAVFAVGRLGHIPDIFLWTTIIGIFMIGSLYIFVRWVNEALDLVIVTNRRIISYDQVNFLDRKMSQTTIDLVQEVNASTSGFFGNIFHYGNLLIKTASDSSAGGISDFNMTHIPFPIETSRKIHGFIDEYRHSLGD